VCPVESITEATISFKTLEKKMFEYICELGRDALVSMLESMDEQLMDERDTRSIAI
jgi:hypothetical protein